MSLMVNSKGKYGVDAFSEDKTKCTLTEFANWLLNTDKE